jgi:hypothetical protein
MKRIALIAALGLLGLAPAAPAAPRSFGIHLTKCHRAVATIDRSFHLRAAMHPVAHTRTMGIRFDLQARVGRHGRWQRYGAVFGQAADGFGTWYRSEPGVERYRYLRLVNGLDGAPGRGGRHLSVSYRVRTGFRWYDAQGDVLKTRHRHSHQCFQPELRPDLHVTRVLPVAGGLRVVVRNRGRTAAGPFGVGLSLPNLDELDRPVSGLPAGGTIRLRFPSGNACPVTAKVDEAGSIDEADESDNEHALACP